MVKATSLNLAGLPGGNNSRTIWPEPLQMGVLRRLAAPGGLFELNWPKV